jgi:hypothetical protein
LLVADADIHSGVHGFGLTSDSFVLQGGDPWGFQTGDAFALRQVDGFYIFAQPVPEPGSALIMVAALTIAAVSRHSIFSSPAA